MSEYRIVRDKFLGFEVQHRTWWWPFWRQTDFVNTHASVEEAEKFARRHASPVVKRVSPSPAGGGDE